MKRKLLIFINIFIIIFLLTAVFFATPKINLVSNLLFKDSNTIEDNYEIEQVKLFSITLETKKEYLENIKTLPLTCNINVDRVTRIIYMDEEEILGTKSVPYRKPVGELMVPTKKGYIFEMWTNKDEEVINEQSIIDSTTDYIIYANWNIIVSNLIINPNGGTWNESTGEQSFSLEYNETKEIPAPTRTGYTFKGWEVTGEDSSVTENIFKMGVENTTIKAIWEANGYKLTINPNEGSYKGSTTPTEISINYDSNIELSIPTRKGYTFIGWTVPAGILNGNNFTMNSTENVTLTANWQVNNYKYIVYHNQQSPDGTAYNKVANDTATGNANYDSVVTPEVKTYTGFITPNKQSLTIDVDEDPPVKNIVNYNYNRKQFTLTINPNTGIWNGETTNKTINLLYQQTYNVANPTKTGYNFTGWEISESTSSIQDLVFSMGLANTTLTAGWKARTYTLTYNVNNGNALTGATSKTITYDSEYGNLPTPTREGYSFSGWYTSKTGGTKVTSATVHKEEKNVTIYAQWTNTAPTIQTVTTMYTNSGLSDNGLIKNGSETATLTINSTDAEDGKPTITIKCVSGKICNSATITKSNDTTFKIKSTTIGAGVIEITATDKAGAVSTNRTIFAVYSEDNNTLVEAKYTDTTYDSGWLEYLDGCYIENFSFEVKFASGHNNSSNNDNMIVYGMTESGKLVVLYTWTGNMLSTLHASDLTILNSQTEKIRQIRFYTYSPHNSCALKATIKYSVHYKFDVGLLESTYNPIS